MRSKNWKIELQFSLTLILTLMVLLCYSAFPAYAHNGEHGEIQIDVVIDNDKGQEVGIKDVDFLLYYVAAWEDNAWSMTLEFDDYKGPFDFKDAKSQEETAKGLYEYVAEKKFKEEEAISNRAGVIEFDNLEPGAYLLIQRAPFVYGDYTYDSAPSVVRVPSNIGDKDYMNVELEPKFTRTGGSGGDKPTPPEETQPSDTTPSKGSDPSTTTPDGSDPTKPDTPSHGHHSYPDDPETPAPPDGSKPNENITIPTNPNESVPETFKETQPGETIPGTSEETPPDETPTGELPSDPENPPKTGDETNILTSMIIMEVSLIAIIALVILIRKKRDDENDKNNEKK